LGGDVFEQSVPEEEKNPKPPPLSKEELDAKKAEYKELKPKERKERQKQFEDERNTVAARKALVERHKYVLSRLHYRYDAATLPEDPKIGAAGSGVEAGVALPKGQKMEASTEVKQVPKSRFQTRYNNFHPWVPVIHCEQPERGKWGKSPPEYRGLRKVWIAEDISRKSRTQIKPAKVVLTALPALGLTGATEQKNLADAGPDASTDAATASNGKCGCRVPGAPAPVSAFGAAALGFVVALLRRRKPKAFPRRSQ
jgi:MYXO-CTERM domain-containing protein